MQQKKKADYAALFNVVMFMIISGALRPYMHSWSILPAVVFWLCWYFLVVKPLNRTPQSRKADCAMVFQVGVTAITIAALQPFMHGWSILPAAVFWIGWHYLVVRPLSRREGKRSNEEVRRPHP